MKFVQYAIMLFDNNCFKAKIVSPDVMQSEVFLFYRPNYLPAK